MGLGYLACGFDLLNVGHLDVIAQARTQCTELVVGVLTDDQVAALTGRHPVVPLAERLVLVGHVRGVSAAVVHDPVVRDELAPDRVFVVAGEPLGDLPDAESLTPARQTASPTLLAALQPVTRRAVA